MLMIGSFALRRPVTFRFLISRLAFVHHPFFTSYLSFSASSLNMSYQGSSGRGGRGGRGGGRGRGEYFKNKYGRGRSEKNPGEEQSDVPRSTSAGGSYADLKRALSQIDGRQYPAYHDLETTKGWKNDDIGFSLYIGRTQSDPFAPPTRCRVVVSASAAQFPPSLYSNKIRAIGLTDFLHRALYAHCQAMGADAVLVGKSWRGPKGGDLQVLEPCQHVLEQSAVTIDLRTGDICAQVTIYLPARGRTVLGQVADHIFDETLTYLVQQSLKYSALNASRLQAHVDSIEDQHWLQQQLVSKNLVSFVRNGAILPRASGVDDRPMTGSVIPFQSPPQLQVSFTLPNAGMEIVGMGIPKGITLICGGGFHGKSTLLETLQVGVYPKLPGDGREFCVTSPTAMKIRAEDGRSVSAVDISPFISNLPFGKDTTCFSTPDASGSTSQASNIVEAVELGTSALLVDEDTCATNFMIRDDKMMQLVAPDKEPITPFVRKVRSLYEDNGISSILVIGGTGDYFDVADNVIMMDCYKCLDVTERAKQIVASSSQSDRHVSSTPIPFGMIRARYPRGDAYKANGKVKVRSKDDITYGDIEIDLSGLEQVVSKSQTTAISCALQTFAKLAASSTSTLSDVLASLEKLMDEGGLDALAPGQYNGGFARPRPLEIAGAVNRLRSNDSMRQNLREAGGAVNRMGINGSMIENFRDV